MKSVYGAGFLLVGLVMGIVLGAYVLYPTLVLNPAAGKNEQVQVNGKVPTSANGATSIEFYNKGDANRTIDTTAPVDNNGQFSVIVVGGFSYQITIFGGSANICVSSIYIPSGVTTITPALACR